MFRKPTLSLVTLCLIASACGDATDGGSLDTVGSLEVEDAPELEPAVDNGLYDSIGRSLGAGSAAIVTGNDGSELSGHLVARVEVQANEMLEFYEPAPGVLLVSGAGAPKNSSLLQDVPADWTPETLDAYWGALAGSAPVPAELRAAVARAADFVPELAERLLRSTGEVAPEAAAEEASNDAPGLEPKAYQAGGGWCESNYYTDVINGYGSHDPLGHCSSNPSMNVCWDHVTGVGAAWHGNSFVMQTNVCPVRGTVTLNLTWSGQTSSFSVPQHTYRWGKFTGGALCGVTDSCGYTESRVINATGDDYHFRYHVLSG